MFIATEISHAADGYALKSRVQMTSQQFALTGAALDRYVAVYGQRQSDHFDAFFQSFLEGTLPSTRSTQSPQSLEDDDDFFSAKPSPVAEIRISHQPYHDIESLYWIIVWFLMRACPRDKPDLVTPRYDQYTAVMIRHQVGREAFGRPTLLGREPELWKQILHPGCAALAGLLSSLGAYLSQRWSDYPTAPKWHAHEAFRRILFRNILRMTEKGVEMPLGDPRRLAKDLRQELALITSSFRVKAMSNKTDAAERVEPSGSKRSRSQSMTDEETEILQKLKKPRLTVPSTGSVDPQPPEDLLVDQWVDRFLKDRKWFR